MVDSKVFISYSSRDAQVVGELEEMLGGAQIPYWKAPEMIPAGSNYAKEIPKVISNCEVFLLVLSEQSQQSIWVEKELDFAINRRKTIVPVKVDEAGLTDLFQFYLNNVQFSVMERESAAPFEELKERLFTLLHMRQKGIRKVLTSSNHNQRRLDVEMNPQPSKCVECGGINLRMEVHGIYICEDCKTENYDYFHIVKNYLASAGPCSKRQIEKETGIPRIYIDNFFRKEMLEIPRSSMIRVKCERCGAPIRTGYLCPNCKG